ncbi:MAG: PorV/PorQ family protein [candidate division FCPU426 bacterium]
MRRLFHAVLFLSLSLVAGTPCLSLAAEGDAGTEGPFNFGVDARAVALGRAYTGVAEDASAIYWNPGGLGRLDKAEVAALYVPLYEQTDYGFLSLAYPIYRLGVIGVGVLAQSSRGIPKTDAYDNSLGEFSDTQLSWLISYSRIWWQNLAAGVNLKGYYHGLDTYSGWGFGLDAGIHYLADAYVPGLSLGLTATNAWPPQVTLVTTPDIYPLNLRLGAGYHFDLDAGGDHRLLISVDGEKPEYAGFKLHAGAEYRLYKIVSVRAGWDHDQPTLGAGATYWDWRLDYALSLQPELGPLHLFTLGWRFGPSLSENAQAERQQIMNELRLSMSKQYNQRGQEHMARHEYAEAVEEFKKALSWMEESGEIAGNLDKAQTAWNRQQAETKAREAERFYSQKAYFDALLSWQGAAKLNPEFPGVKTQIAKAQRALKSQLAAAPRAKAQRAGSREQEAQDLFVQGLAYYADSDFTRAIAKWRAALETDPSHVQAAAYLAKAETQKPQQPLPDVTPTTSERQRQEAQTLYESGLVKYRQREFAQARALWQKTLALDSRHADAQRGLERIEAILKAFEDRGIK